MGTSFPWAILLRWAALSQGQGLCLSLEQVFPRVGTGEWNRACQSLHTPVPSPAPEPCHSYYLTWKQPVLLCSGHGESPQVPWPTGGRVTLLPW